MHTSPCLHFSMCKMLNRSDDFQRGKACIYGMIVIGLGRPEEGQYSVALFSANSTTIAMDCCAHDVDRRTQLVERIFRVEPVYDRSRTNDIGKKDRDQLSFGVRSIFGCLNCVT